MMINIDVNFQPFAILTQHNDNTHQYLVGRSSTQEPDWSLNK